MKDLQFLLFLYDESQKIIKMIMIMKLLSQFSRYRTNKKKLMLKSKSCIKLTFQSIINQTTVKRILVKTKLPADPNNGAHTVGFKFMTVIVLSCMNINKKIWYQLISWAKQTCFMLKLGAKNHKQKGKRLLPLLDSNQNIVFILKKTIWLRHYNT